MKKLLLLYNPVAGRSVSLQKMGDMVHCYNRKGYAVTAIPIRQYDAFCGENGKTAADFDHVVVTGGDGSVHEALNHGVMDFGYIPCGSANDIGHSLGISLNPEESMISAVEGRPVRMDIGSFNGTIFAYVAAFGLFTEVTYQTPQKMKKDLGYLAYLLQGVKSLADIKSYPMHITDGSGKTYDGEYMVGLIANSYSIGGFKNPMSQDVALDDGLFEGVFIKKPADILEFNELLDELINNRVGGNSLDYIKSDQMMIECRQPVAWTLDGDYGGTDTKMEIKCLKQALTIR